MDDCVYRKAEKAKRAGKELFSLGVRETLPLHIPVGRRLMERGSWRFVLHLLSVVYPFVFVVLLAVFRFAIKKVQVCSRQTSTTSLGLKTCDAVVFLLASVWAASHLGYFLVKKPLASGLWPWCAVMLAGLAASWQYLSALQGRHRKVSDFSRISCLSLSL